MKYFPAKKFQNAKGVTASLFYNQLHVSDWPEPVLFQQITSAALDDHFMKKRLTLHYVQEHTGKAQTVKLNPLDFTNPEDGDLLKAFQAYYGRHKTAEARRGV